MYNGQKHCTHSCIFSRYGVISDREEPLPGRKKMKKTLVFILCTVIILLGACSTQRYQDAVMFCRGFNKAYGEKIIDLQTASVTELDGCTEYNFLICDGLLIKLCTDGESPNLKSISIVAHGSTDELKSGLFDKFAAVCRGAITSYSNGADGHETVFGDLNIPESANYETAVPQHSQSGDIKYTYSADVTGAFFMMENRSLCRTDEEALTLRSDTDKSS